MSWCGDGRRRRQAEGDDHAGERQQQPGPLHGAEAIGREKPARAEHDEERREIDEQRRARGRGVEEPAIDQQELDPEQQAGDDAGRQRAVAPQSIGKPRSRMKPSTISVARRERMRALDQRRNVRQRELDRRLVEAPEQAQEHHQHHAGGVERPACGCAGMRSSTCLDVVNGLLRGSARQCAQTPVISITGAFGVKPAARAADLS